MPANYVLLERIELNASAASVTFANIPQTGYTDLKVVMSVRSDRTSADQDSLLVSFNGSTANFTNKSLEGGTVTTVSSFSSARFLGSINDANNTASVFSSVELYVPNYASSNFKSFSTDSAMPNNSTFYYLDLTAGLWSDTSAITSIAFTTGASRNFVANSTFSLYGLAATGTTPVIAPKATGGNIIDFDGTYWIHTFNTSGTFTPSTGLSCDYLVVAGGGGGGFDIGSGGGAGGYRAGSSLSVTTTPYTITVGAGSPGGTTGARSAANGSDSVFSTITSAGGGGGQGNFGTAGLSGGSGSGGAGSFATGPFAGGAGNTPSTSPSQGNNGGTGTGIPGDRPSPGGGGGAGAVGGNATTTVAGTGGAGTASSITGSSVTRAGGGGGGGSTSFAVTAGGGGAGGGGAGSATSVGSAGTANTGGAGGGGGAPSGGSPQNGGAGGSGIVIIRYLA